MKQEMDSKFKIDGQEFRNYAFEDQILRTNIFTEYVHSKKTINDDLSLNTDINSITKQYSLMNIFDDPVLL